MVAGRRWCWPWKCFGSSWFIWSGVDGASWVRLEPGNNAALPRKPSNNIPFGFSSGSFFSWFLSLSIHHPVMYTDPTRQERRPEWSHEDDAVLLLKLLVYDVKEWTIYPTLELLGSHLIRLIVFCWFRASNFYVGWTGWGWVESPLKAELPGQHVYCSYRPGYILDWRQERSQSKSVLLLGLMLLAHSSTIRGVSGITPFGIAWVEWSVPVHGSLFTYPSWGCQQARSGQNGRTGLSVAAARNLERNERKGKELCFCCWSTEASSTWASCPVTHDFTSSGEVRVPAFKIISKCGFWKACLFRHSSLIEFQGTHSS